MSRDPTPAQRQAIAARGGDVCVAAGAGSGKTFVLVERFVGLVREDGLDPERILTITFTEKAAQEMAERIAHALEDQGRGGARRLAEAGWVSTIHGFCARLLRERALEAGVDPAFSVLTDVPAARARRAAFLTAQRRFQVERPGAWDGLVEQVRWGRDQDGAAQVESLVFQLYEETRAAGHRLGPVEEQPREALLQPEVSQALAGLAEAVQSFLLAVGSLPRPTARSERQAREVAALSARLAQAPLDVFRPGVYHDLAALARLATGAGPLGPSLARLRLAAEAAAGAYAEGPARALGGGLGHLLHRFDQEFRAVKAAQSALDFSDLEERTLELLEGRPDVLDEVRRQFQAVLVDEFQDTSRVQQRLVELLRSPDNLFLVGDVKQSIYGFRHAEVRGLLGWQERIRAAQGHVIDLDVSFRTRPEVLGFVDEVFARVWSEPGSEVPHQPLRAGCEFSPKAGPSLELVVGRGESLERGRAQEARAVAARLATLIEERQLCGTNPLRSEACGRALRYRDCAILVPATTALRFYERALRERGVPYRVASGRGFYGAREVVDAVQLLRVAGAAHDDLALAAYLRSPAAGLSDQALLQLARLRGRGQPLAELLRDEAALARAGLEPRDLARAEAARALVAELRALRGRRSTRELLELALERSGLLDGSLLRGGDLRAYANLRKLLELVEGLERDGVAGPGEVAAVLEDLRLSGARESEANVSAGDEDAVSVLTVHAAKGLEWPLVVVADLGRRLPPVGAAVAWSEATGVVPDLRDPERPQEAVTAGSLRRLREERRAREREESKRLLYVAMTRAQDHLILAGAQSYRGAAGDWLAWVRLALDGAEPEGGESDPAAGAPARLLRTRAGWRLRHLEPTQDLDGTPLAGPCGPAIGARPLLQPADTRALGRGERPALRPASAEAEEAAAALLRSLAAPALPEPDQSASVTTVSEVVTWRDCPRRALLRHVLHLDEAPAGEAPWGEREAVPAAALGTACHDVLGRLIPARLPHVERKLEQLLLPRTAPARRLEEAARRVLELAGRFPRCSLGERAERAAEVRREHPLLVALDLPGTDEPILLRGTVDLVFRDEAGWVLVDYKTTDLTALEVPGRARTDAFQLQLYALALARAGIQIREAWLAYLAAEAEHPVPLGPTDLEEAEAALADYAAARRAMDLPPRPGPRCLRCPVRASCPAGNEVTPALADGVPRGIVAPRTSEGSRA